MKIVDINNLPLKYGCPHYERGRKCNPKRINNGRFLKDFPNWVNDHCKKFNCPCYCGLDLELKGEKE